MATPFETQNGREILVICAEFFGPPGPEVPANLQTVAALTQDKVSALVAAVAALDPPRSKANHSRKKAMSNVDLASMAEGPAR